MKLKFKVKAIYPSTVSLGWTQNALHWLVYWMKLQQRAGMHQSPTFSIVGRPVPHASVFQMAWGISREHTVFINQPYCHSPFASQTGMTKSHPDSRAPCLISLTVPPAGPFQRIVVLWAPLTLGSLPTSRTM